MVKVTLNNIGTGTAFQTAIPTINSNNDTIETAFDNTLSRDGTTPNTMLSNLDMNSYAILNLPMATDPTSPVRLQEVGDTPGYAVAAAASAAAASASASSASTSAGTATTQAGIATTQAGIATTQAGTATTQAGISTANATVVEGNEYSFATSTTMGDPGTGLLRFNNATPTSATAIAISAQTNASGNPNIRTFIAAWDDSSNTVRGNILIRKIGTPATFVVYNITGALTDNTSWLQLTVTGVTGSGSFSASDRLSVQFIRSGDAGSMTGPGVSVDSEIAIYNGTGGTALKRATNTGILKATSGVIATATSGTDYQAPIGTISGVAKGNGANALTAATAGSDYVAPATATSFTAQQYFTIATLTDAANISWTVSSGQKAKVTLGGNRTMNAVTGSVEGATYFLWIIQDATGSRTMTWTTTGSGSFDFGTSGAPTLTTTANKADLLTFEAVTIGGTLKLRYTGIARGFS